MRSCFIRVSGDPVPKGRPRLGRNGNVYTPARTAEYERAIGWEWRKAQHPKLDGALWVEIEVGEGKYPADLDNYVKAALDALNGIAWDDDRQVTSIDAEIMRGVPKPYLEVRVSVRGPRRDNIMASTEASTPDTEALSVDLGP